MKKITLSLLSLLGAGFALSPALAASDVMVAASMQRCATNEECALVTNSCQDNCGFVPVNKSNLPALEGLYQSRCGKPISANPTCNMNPPIAAACVNSRCTIDYAYANNAGPEDYKSGAYPVPEAPVPSAVPAQDYSHVNDRTGGFTAYDLPQTEVKQNTVGTLHTKIYVPPSAPVSGGNYVAIGSDPAVSMTAPVVPGAVPVSPRPDAAPSYVPPVAPAPAPVAAPTNIPPVAVPTSKSYATPPVMTPSVPNQLPPTESAPQAYTPPTYVAPETKPTGPAIPSVGAPGVPQAPPGSTPIPPSDLKPTPTFVPPTGTAVKVSPEDPGAVPPPGTKIMMKGQPGSEDMVPMSTKSFGGVQAKKSKAVTNTNE